MKHGMGMKIFVRMGQLLPKLGRLGTFLAAPVLEQRTVRDGDWCTLERADNSGKLDGSRGSHFIRKVDRWFA